MSTIIAAEPSRAFCLDTLPDSALLSVQDFCQHLDVSKATGWRLLKRNPNLKPIKLGARVTRLRVADVRAYLASLQVSSGLESNSPTLAKLTKSKAMGQQEKPAAIPAPDAGA